jgi:hypothetical protein
MRWAAASPYRARLIADDRDRESVASDRTDADVVAQFRRRPPNEVFAGEPVCLPRIAPGQRLRRRQGESGARAPRVIGRNVEQLRDGAWVMVGRGAGEGHDGDDADGRE